MKKKYLVVEFESYKCKIIIIGICISLSIIIFTFLGSLNIDSLVWTLEILFIIFLSCKIFKIQKGKHHIVSIILLAVVLFTMDIISSFLTVTIHKDCGEQKCEEKYWSDNNEYVLVYNIFHSWAFMPLIFLIFIIAYASRDYCWVKSKYLMDIKNVETHILLYSIGIIGSLLSIVFLIFSSSLPCKSFENVEKIDNNLYSFIYFNNNTTQNISLDNQICLFI